MTNPSSQMTPVTQAMAYSVHQSYNTCQHLCHYLLTPHTTEIDTGGIHDQCKFSDSYSGVGIVPAQSCVQILDHLTRPPGSTALLPSNVCIRQVGIATMVVS